MEPVGGSAASGGPLQNSAIDRWFSIGQCDHRSVAALHVASGEAAIGPEGAFPSLHREWNDIQAIAAAT